MWMGLALDASSAAQIETLSVTMSVGLCGLIEAVHLVHNGDVEIGQRIELAFMRSNIRQHFTRGAPPAP